MHARTVIFISPITECSHQQICLIEIAVIATLACSFPCKKFKAKKKKKKKNGDDDTHSKFKRRLR